MGKQGADTYSEPLTVIASFERLNQQFNDSCHRYSNHNTINFDRNKIRKMCADLSKKSDETSATLDAALVNTPVEYEAPFDVNEAFAEAFEAHMSALS